LTPAAFGVQDWPMPVEVICISRATGAEGEAVGRTVAERLGYRYVDNEVIEQAAEWADLAPEFVADAERRKPFLARLLGPVLGDGSATRLPGDDPARSLPNDADLRMLIATVLHSLAEEGSAVIVAHAASFALAGRDVLRVLVTASSSTRAGRLARSRALDEREAARVVASDDVDRLDYLKRFYDVDRELPTDYDLVVNTDMLSAGDAADLIVAAAS
jgi:cytidylate kinase